MNFAVAIKTCLTILTLLTAVHLTSCHLITIEPHHEECFHENLTRGTKIRFTFEVLDGGSLDIDLSIRDPSNIVIHAEQRQSSGRYAIEANQDGRYTYCFSNKMSSLTTKIIMFDVEFTDLKKSNDVEHDRLSDMVTELTSLVTAAKHEIAFLEARDTIHRTISENINARVSLWSLFEAILVIFVGACQVFYLRRLFESRRRV